MNNNISRQSSFSSLNAQSSLQDFEKWGDALKKTTESLEGHKVTTSLLSSVNRTSYTVEDIIRISSNALNALSQLYERANTDTEKNDFLNMAHHISQTTKKFIKEYESQKTLKNTYEKIFEKLKNRKVLTCFVQAFKQFHLKVITSSDLPAKIEAMMDKINANSSFIKQAMNDNKRTNATIETLLDSLTTISPTGRVILFEKDMERGQRFTITDQASDIKIAHQMSAKENSQEVIDRAANSLNQLFIKPSDQKWKYVVQALVTQTPANALGDGEVKAEWMNDHSKNLPKNILMSTLEYNSLSEEELEKYNSNNQPIIHLTILRNEKGEIEKVQVNTESVLHEVTIDRKGNRTEGDIKSKISLSFGVKLDEENSPIIVDFNRTIDFK